jgi:lincosamide nucleotidyltransferase A/C/D/E
MMNSQKVKEVLDILSSNGVKVWLDGGWGVDALLHQQTRKHEDLDIVITNEDCEKAIALLEEYDYSLLIEDDTKAWNFVLSDGANAIDFHVVDFDDTGKAIYGPKDGGASYPEYAFGTKGKIEGMLVPCLSPKYQLESHRGYPLREKDRQDIQRLCEKFDLAVPEELKQLN